MRYPLLCVWAIQMPIIAITVLRAAAAAIKSGSTLKDGPTVTTAATVATRYAP
jgi:hypothetical protein